MKRKTCGGACCKRFILPYSPEEIEEQYRAWIVGGGYRGSHPVLQKRGNTPDERKQCLPRYYQEDVVPIDPEVYLVYPMLIYLGYCNFEPCRPRTKTKQRAHHYTCKHFDKKTGLCTIYEHRPLMCRRYPNDEACLYRGCKLPGNKKKLAKQKAAAEKYAIRKDREGAYLIRERKK